MAEVHDCIHAMASEDLQPSTNSGCLFWGTGDTYRLAIQCELILLEITNHMALSDASTCLLTIGAVQADQLGVGSWG